jgi:hypothetical protein
LFLQARRLVRDGRRVGNPEQKYLERNRARAITKAMQAYFEEEPERKEASTRAEKQSIPVQIAWLNLLESLQREFQILEVEYPEIAPLVLGSSLQQMGFAGLRNENDYFQTISRSSDWQAGRWLANIPRQFAQQNFHQLSPIAALNEARFPRPANLVRRWWSQALRFDPKKKAADRPQVKGDGGAPKATPNPRTPALRLVGTLKKVEGVPTTDILRAALEAFEKTAGGTPLYRALGLISQAEAQVARQAYRGLQNQYKLSVLEKGWDDQGAKNALDSARQEGICLLFFIIHQEQEPRAQAALARLQETAPQGMNLHILSYWKYKSNKDDTPLLKVEIVLSQPMEKKVP